MAVRFASKNLIVNGGAEIGPVAHDFGSDVPPQGWTSTGTMTAVAYAAGSGGDLTTEDGLAAQGGTAYFAGGSSAGISTATQRIDVTGWAARIDTGRAGMVLAAETGGYAWQDDHATVQVNCLAADGSLLGTLTLDGVLSAERGSDTHLVALETAMGVYSGTRTLEVVLTMTRAQGTYNDGYADNISLHLTGLTRGQLQIDASGDYSAIALPATGVSFMGLGDTAALLSGAQFGTVFGARPLIEGSVHVDSLTVNLAAGASFSAAGFRFAGWTDDTDVLLLDGAEGTERITGSDMADQIGGGLGRDTLAGGDGADWIDGAQGIDLLRGGLGADDFVLATKAADRDVIADFASGDHLLVHIGAYPTAAGLAPGALGSAFLANLTGLAEGTEDRFIYDTDAGRLYFDVDGLGGGKALLIATFTGAPVLTEGDFLVL